MGVVDNKTVANHINLYCSSQATTFSIHRNLYRFGWRVFLLNWLAAFSPQTFLDKRGIKTEEES